MKLLYRIFTLLYPLGAYLICGYNNKAKFWLKGRKNIFTRMKTSFDGNTQKIIWVHCSSLGEFEQGRPLIEVIKKQYPAFKIVLTFFSPSGYEIRKDYKNADWIYYLPMDSPINAKRFLDIVKPHLIFFIKYEFWYYYLNEIKKRQIPLLLVSGTFRKDQPFFAWYGNFHRTMLQCFTHIFVQNETSATLLANIGFKQNVSVCGDTRFDRVIEIADAFEHITLIEKFIAQDQVIVAGSTWTEDDEELDHYANTHPEIKFIVAPHDIDEDRIKECLLLYKHSILFSQLGNDQPNLESTNVVIIDNIGMLSKLYRYATICYVGGAFGDDGVHNVLEAAVYNKPVVFGPEFDKYAEAVELIDTGGGFTIESAVELEKVLNNLLKEGELYRQASFKAGNYVKNRSGATKKILQYIYENRLLTN